MKIPGPALLGFGDFFARPGSEVNPIGVHPWTGNENVGAAPRGGRRPPAPPRGKAPARGGRAQAPAQAPRGPSISRQRADAAHRGALSGAVSSGARAIAVAARLAKSVAQYQAESRAGRHAPLIPLAPAAIRGGQVVLGAAPAVAAALNPRQRQAVARHANAVMRHGATVRQAAAWAPRIMAAGQAAKAFAGAAARLHRQGGAAIMGALLSMDDDELMEMIGQDDGSGVSAPPDGSGDQPSADQGAPAPPSGGPGMPRFDSKTFMVYAPDGSVLYDPSGDPNVQGLGPGSVDPTAGTVTAPDGTVLYPGFANDPDLQPVPVRGVPLTDADAWQEWDDLPAGAIVYRGAWGWPGGSLGSAEKYFPHSSAGDAGFLLHDDGWWYSSGGGDDWHRAQGDNRSLARQSIGSPGPRWGPLIANPQGPLAGAQFAINAGTQGAWFWQPQHAPAALTAAADSAIAAANQAAQAQHFAQAKAQLADIVTANQKAMQADAMAAYGAALQAAKDAAAQAEAQAKAEADLALAQTQAQAAQTRMDVQAQQAEIDQAKQQAQIQAQAQQLQLEQVRQYNDWAAAHPDEAAAAFEGADQGDEGDAGDESDTGDEGGGDDTGDDFGDTAAEDDASAAEDDSALTDEGGE